MSGSGAEAAATAAFAGSGAAADGRALLPPVAALLPVPWSALSTPPLLAAALLPSTVAAVSLAALWVGRKDNNFQFIINFLYLPLLNEMALLEVVCLAQIIRI